MEGFEIIVGTYENLLIGYKLVTSFVNKKPVLETSFTDDSHRGALRCVTVSQAGVLASSSTDDSIRLHSLRKRKEVGGLFEHSGTVNSMVFYDKNHMFSASEDGTICLWQSKNWELMRTLKGHKAHVMAVAVHPSGKLGLSVGSDRSFLTWDLLTGKLAFQRKLTDVAQNVFFTPSGDHYILVFNKKIEVCSLSDTKVVKDIPTDWRINAVCHVQDNIFAVGGDDRLVLLIDVLEGKQLAGLDAAKTTEDDFKSRVRCLCIVERDGNKLLFLATASGDIKAFQLDLVENNAEELFFGEAKVRVTTMGVYNSQNKANGAGPQAADLVEETEKEVDRPDEDSDEDNGAGEDEDTQDTGRSRPKKRKADRGSEQKAKKKKKELVGGHDNKQLKKSKKAKETTEKSEESMTEKRKVKRKNK